MVASESEWLLSSSFARSGPSGWGILLFASLLLLIGVSTETACVLEQLTSVKRGGGGEEKGEGWRQRVSV